MPQVKRTEHISVHYTPGDVKRLIMRDLAENHGVNAQLDDIILDITGGDYVPDDDGSYSGGSISSGGGSCTPVKYDGYHVRVTTEKQEIK